MSGHAPKKAPTQRQLRVGEEIRHIVSEILMRNETHHPDFESLSITVSEVRISPDLKNANVYVTPLAGMKDPEELVEKLNLAAPAIRRVMGKKVVLRYLPKLFFKIDKSFDEAGRINQLLMNDPKIREDIGKDDEPESS